MSAIREVKIRKEYFAKDQSNSLEARIARFPLKKGDFIRFREWDPKTEKYTGRFFDRKVLNFHKIHRAIKLWKKKDLEEFGLYIFQLEKIARR